MKLSLAICATAASAAIGVALWPHASDAWMVLGSQDDPAALSGAQLTSALRNNPGLIHENIEAALAANDADLAGSFASWRKTAASRSIMA